MDPQTASDNGNIYRSIVKKRLKSGNALSNKNEESKPFIVKKKMKKLRKSGEKNSIIRNNRNSNFEVKLNL